MSPTRPARALRLSDLSPPAAGRVARVDEAKAPLVSSFGIYPGVRIELAQKRPTFVVRCQASEIALEEALARAVWIELGK